MVWAVMKILCFSVVSLAYNWRLVIEIILLPLAFFHMDKNEPFFYFENQEITSRVMVSSLLPQFEDAAKEVVDEITRPRPEGEEEVEDIQVMLTSASNACSIRELKVMVVKRLLLTWNYFPLTFLFTADII